jgi:hypothetical protein
MNLYRKFNANQLYVDGVLGQYSLGVTSGVIGVNATGEIFQFRWSDPVRICAVQRLGIVVIASGAPTAVATAQIDVIHATAWSAQGTGGTAIDMTAGTNKHRSGMDTSKIPAGDIRMATTAALGAGTKTLEANSLSSIQASGSAAPLLSYTRILESRPGDQEYPLVLQPNEGFVVKIISNGIGGNTTGTFVVSIDVDWLETNAS